MKIYLARHGDYTVDMTNLDMLTEKGKQDMSAMAHFLQGLNLRVVNIFHSVKNRAQQSAELLAQGIVSETPMEMRRGLAPEDDEVAFANEIIHWDDDILVVGHLPFIGRLVSLLVTGNPNKEIVEFETGTLVCLEQKEQTRWAIRWVLATELL
jgi:phosphohistidine phosphatase